MVKVVSGGSKVGVDSVGIVCVVVGLVVVCRAPGRELGLENTHFSRFGYLPDLESASNARCSSQGKGTVEAQNAQLPPFSEGRNFPEQPPFMWVQSDARITHKD